jgi:hypothetical protein
VAAPFIFGKLLADRCRKVKIVYVTSLSIVHNARNFKNVSINEVTVSHIHYYLPYQAEVNIECLLKN